jgi:hypothetical protein
MKPNGIYLPLDIQPMRGNRYESLLRREECFARVWRSRLWGLI